MNIFCQNFVLGRQHVVNFRSFSRFWSCSKPQILYKSAPTSALRQFSPSNRILTPLLVLRDKRQLEAKFFAASAVSFRKSAHDNRVHMPFAVDERTITNDVLIYSHDNDRFYKLLTFFGIVQFFFWVHLAGFSYTTLRDVDPTLKRQRASGGEESSVWWKRINLGKDKYRYGMAVLCISVGYLLLFISLMFPKRAIKELVLKKGGKMVQITTFGRKSTESVSVGSINCLQQRSSAKNQIPMKIKGKWFYFLLDKKGVFHNEYLFDYLIGLKRSLK